MATCMDEMMCCDRNCVLSAVGEQDPAINSLMGAVVENNPRKVEDLLRNRLANVDAIDLRGFSALMYACKDGFLPVVRKLIEYDVAVNYRHPDTGNTALHLAAQSGHTRTVELLVKSGGADRNVTNAFGKTAYEAAVNCGHGDNMVMRELLAPGRREAAATSPPPTDANNNTAGKMERTSSTLSLNTVAGVEGETIGRKHANNKVSMLAYKNANNDNKNGLRRARSDPRLNQQGPMPREGTVPSRALLEIFTNTGIYYIMPSGFGYGLLYRHEAASELPALFVEVAKNLSLIDTTTNNNNNNANSPVGGNGHGQLPTVMQMVVSLKEILNDFERNDHLMDNVNMDHINKIVARGGDSRVRRNRNRQQRFQQRHHHHQSDEELTKATAISNYVEWKKHNQLAISQLVKTLVLQCQ